MVNTQCYLLVTISESVCLFCIDTLIKLFIVSVGFLKPLEGPAHPCVAHWAPRTAGRSADEGRTPSRCSSVTELVSGSTRLEHASVS